MVFETEFSKDWYRFYEEHPLIPGENWLREIEGRLSMYQSAWKKTREAKIREIEFTGLEGTRGYLESLARESNLAQRVVVCRSIHLIEGFISSINRDDFASSPFLLRAVMEEAGFGFHLVKRLRAAFEALRDGKQEGEKLVLEATAQTSFGAKMNVGAFGWALLDRMSKEESYVAELDEYDLVKELINQGAFSRETTPVEYQGYVSASIQKMMEELAKEVRPEGAPPNALLYLWEYFSQYCHPSAFSWSFEYDEVLRGGEYLPSAADRDNLRIMALSRFIRPMFEFVVDLPGRAATRLAELQLEIQREVDLLERKP